MFAYVRDELRAATVAGAAGAAGLAPRTLHARCLRETGFGPRTLIREIPPRAGDGAAGDPRPPGAGGGEGGGLRQSMETDGRSHPHIAVAVLHDRQDGVARQPRAQRRALDRHFLIRCSNAPQAIPEGAYPEHVMPVVHQPVARRFQRMRRRMWSAQLTKAGCDVGRPDASLAVFVESPYVLVRSETKLRPGDLLEHAPASPHPKRPGAAREYVTDLAGACLPRKGHPVPSVFIPRNRSQSTMAHIAPRPSSTRAVTASSPSRPLS